MNYTIETKEDSYGQLIYTVKPPLGQGRKLKYPIGWFICEDEAIEAYEKAMT